MIYNDLIELIEVPKVLKLSDNLYALKFDLMKLLPARYIIEKALENGELTKDMTVVESSSGTFALGLALVCSKHKIKLIIIGDPAIDKKLKSKLEMLGTIVEIIEPIEGIGIQKLRLDRLYEIKNGSNNMYWPNQYDNPRNSESYGLVADLIKSTMGKLDCLIGPVGSGGSMCGIGRYLRESNKDLNMIGLDTHASVLFGQNDGPRPFRGLGNSVYPKNLKQHMFDEIHWINANHAYLACKVMYKGTGMFMGGTSGASYLTGVLWSKTNSDKKTLIILPDEGYRYEDTIYNDEWLKLNNQYANNLPKVPVLVDDPLNCKRIEWNYMHWNRREIEHVQLELKEKI